MRNRLPEAALTLQPSTHPEIQFAGQTAQFKQVPFQLATRGNEIKYRDNSATLTDFKIEPPARLTVPVKNAIPVRVEMTRRPQ